MRNSVLAVALASVLAGCGAATSVAPSVEAAYAGTYALQTVNGTAPPAVISQTAQRTVEVVSATLVVRGDRTYSLTDQLRITAGGTAVAQSDVSTGTWTAGGTRITFVPATPGLLDVTTLDWRDGRLVLSDASGSVPVTMVFGR